MSKNGFYCFRVHKFYNTNYSSMSNNTDTSLFSSFGFEKAKQTQ